MGRRRGHRGRPRVAVARPLVLLVRRPPASSLHHAGGHFHRLWHQQTRSNLQAGQRLRSPRAARRSRAVLLFPRHRPHRRRRSARSTHSGWHHFLEADTRRKKQCHFGRRVFGRSDKQDWSGAAGVSSNALAVQRTRPVVRPGSDGNVFLRAQPTNVSRAAGVVPFSLRKSHIFRKLHGRHGGAAVFFAAAALRGHRAGVQSGGHARQRPTVRVSHRSLPLAVKDVASAHDIGEGCDVHARQDPTSRFKLAA